MQGLKGAARRQRRSPGEIMDRILRAAADEFRGSGYASTTTASIARTADVTEAQLFRYFASKAELFREAVFKPMNQHFSNFNARHLKEADEGDNVRDLAVSHIDDLQDFLGDHSDMLLALFIAQTYTPGSTDSVEEIDGLQAYFERGAEMMRRRTKGKPDVDPRILVRVSFAAVLGLVLFRDWLFPEHLASDETIRTAIHDFIIGGTSINAYPGQGTEGG